MNPKTRRIPFGSFLFLAHCVLLAGCVSASSHVTPPVGSGAGLDGPGSQSASAKELDAATRMLKAGDYSHAIPRLQEIANKYPDSAAANDSQYYLGLAYVGIRGYSAAERYFSAYIERAPEGQHAAEAREQRAAIAESAQSQAQTRTQLTEAIEEAVRKAAAAPDELVPQLELADLYWKNSQYAEAGAVYSGLLKTYPDLSNDTTIRTRITVEADGRITVLTPVEVVQREADRDPLVIFNTQSFRSGRNQGFPRGLRNDRYNVSGQVMNRGRETLSEVEVIVTIYGFGSKIYGTQTVRVGRLAPDARRAFSVQFRDFDTIENVDRYEVVGTYLR